MSKLDTPREIAAKMIFPASEMWVDVFGWSLRRTSNRGDCIDGIRRALERLLEDREKEIRDDERRAVLAAHGIGF